MEEKSVGNPRFLRAAIARGGDRHQVQIRNDKYHLATVAAGLGYMSSGAAKLEPGATGC